MPDRLRNTGNTPLTEPGFEVVYWPTERTCVTYDTREEAVAAVAWYERTYDPPPNSIGIREVVRDAS